MSLSTVRTLIIALLLAGLLAACSKVTQENFSKLEAGMSEQQVYALLGEPTESSSINLGGLSGTSAVWRDKDAEIRVQFFNGTLKVMDFRKSAAAP